MVILFILSEAFIGFVYYFAKHEYLLCLYCILEMAKRSNPFVEDFIPQSKIHVGIRQFNNNDDRLKNVYEKTLDLLFKGAKKILTQDAARDSDVMSGKKDKMKQLFIGNDGVLQHSGSLVSSNSVSKLCLCGEELECQCAYCEVTLCGECQHACSQCLKSYCSRCTLLGSGGLDVCVSCVN